MENDSQAMREALESALSLARKAIEEGDAGKASVLLGNAAEWAGRIAEADGMSGSADDWDPGFLEEEGVNPAEVVTHALAVGEGSGLRNAATHSALVWKVTERDMRVFFLRNLPEVFEGFRERYEQARKDGDWEVQWASFRGLGELMTLVSRMKVPKKML